MEFPEVIQLNVGGQHFTTSLATLTKYPDSMLAAMFSGRHHVAKDGEGRFFIDADGDAFVHILKFLRFQKPPPPEDALEVLEYAEYFGISELKTVLGDYMPVKAIPLYERVRKANTEYESLLKYVLCELSKRDIVSRCALLIVQNSRYTEDSLTRDFDHEFKRSVFKDYTRVEVTIHTATYGIEVATAAALVHDLKAYGIYPADEVIYRPDPACRCTAARNITLTV